MYHIQAQRSPRVKELVAEVEESRLACRQWIKVNELPIKNIGDKEDRKKKMADQNRRIKVAELDFDGIKTNLKKLP